MNQRDEDSLREKIGEIIANYSTYAKDEYGDEKAQTRLRDEVLDRIMALVDSECASEVQDRNKIIDKLRAENEKLKQVDYVGWEAYSEKVLRDNNELRILVKELVGEAEKTHHPFQHDYVSDEKKCPTCKLIQRAKEAGVG